MALLVQPKSASVTSSSLNQTINSTSQIDLASDQNQTEVNKDTEVYFNSMNSEDHVLNEGSNNIQVGMSNRDENKIIDSFIIINSSSQTSNRQNGISQNSFNRNN